MPAARGSPTPYREFRRRVRRYRRSDLLRLIAQFSVVLRSAYLGRTTRPPWPSAVQEFALAGIARTALASCCEERDGGPSEDDLIRLCHMYINIDDPHLSESETPDLDTARYVLTRIAYEQFLFQYSSFENIARSLTLLIDHMAQVPGAPSEDEWASVLGVPLADFMRTGFAAFIAMQSNQGAIERSVLFGPDVASVFAPLSPAQAAEVIDRHFSSSLDDLKAAAQAAEIADYEKWSHNPLEARPLVRIDDAYLSPVPAYIIEKITPGGLYYTGVDKFGARFTDALGTAFEQYVGSQLRLITNATVLPEITYDKNGQQKTVDWFVVTDEVVILVEAKSSRPVLRTRMGDPDSDDDLTRKIGHASDQIARTVELIRADHPALAAVPKDRPLRGIVLTLAPFHLLGTFDDGILRSPADVPVTLASAHDLEGTVAPLATCTDVGQRLLDALTPAPPEPADIRKAVAGLAEVRNPILDESWVRFAGSGSWDAGRP